MHLCHMNEFRIFNDIQSITFLLYTLKIVILPLIMLLLGYQRPCGIPDHAKLRPLARNGKQPLRYFVTSLKQTYDVDFEATPFASECRKKTP